MDVQVTAAAPAEQPQLAALFELYVYDFSELLGLDVGDDGRFATPPLALWWTEPRRHPFLIRVDGRLAGFALVLGRSKLTGDEAVTDMAEFFVLRRYRRQGVGERAAHAVFARFPGAWEVRERRGNEAAIAFWRRVVGRCTDGRYDEEHLDDARWRGAVQRFVSRAAG